MNEQQPFVRTLRYWFDGDGQWMNRLHCTNGDLLLMSASVILGTAIVLMYIYYALLSHQASYVVRETHFSRHLSELRNTFVVCGLVHFFSHVVSWVMPLHWLCVLLMVGVVFHTSRLILRKRMVIAIQRAAAGEVAIEKVRDALTVIDQAKLQRVEADYRRLENILRRMDHLPSSVPESA